MKVTILGFTFTVIGLCLLAQIPPAQRESNNPVHYFEEAEKAFRARDYQEALILYNQSLILNPLFAEAYYGRGMTKERLDDLNGALVDYTLSLELKPQQYEPLLARGILRYQLEKWDQAKADFESLLWLAPGETNTVFFRQDAYGSGVDRIFTAQGANKAYVHNYLGLVSNKLGLYEKAIVHFDSAYSQYPEVDYIINKGLCLQALGRLNEARSAYELALRLEPANSLAKHNMGLLASSQGNSREAESMINDAIENNPNLPYPYAERAHFEFLAGDFKKCIADYTKAIALNPKEMDYRINRAIAYEKLQDYESAFTDYTIVLRTQPKSEKAWFNRGNLLYKLRRYEEAEKDFSQAILMHSEYAMAYYGRALARHYAGKKTEACEDLRSASTLGFRVEARVAAKICGSNK